MGQRPYTKFLLAGVSATAVLVGAQDAQVALADQTHSGTTTAGVEITDYTGTFTNTGDISGPTTGVWSANAFTGKFTNKGDISGPSYGVIFKDTFDGDNFTNSGNITSTGTSSSAYAVYFNSTFTDDFTNSGNITATATATGTDTTAYGVFFNSTFTGNFNNSGDITATGTSAYGVFFNSTFDGTFTNEADGTITGGDYGVYFAGAFGSKAPSTFKNEADGTITGGDYGVSFNSTFDGDFSNSGNIEGDYAGVYFAGAFGSATSPDSEFTNSGNIIATGNFTNSEKITAENNYSVYGVTFNNTFDGDFTNEGDISATGNFNNSGDINDEDNYGPVNYNVYGVYFGSTLPGNFTNNGNITAIGDFTNSGNIYGTVYYNVYGVKPDGSFINEGNITATSNFTNSGNISSTSGPGVEFGNTFDGNFTNSGSITATGSSGAGVYFNSKFTGDLINTGNISGTGSNDIYIDGDFTGNMTQTVGVRVDVGGTANLTEYTIYVGGFVKDDYTWDAIQAEEALDENLEPTDNSFLVSFEKEIVGGTATFTTIVNSNVSDMASGDYSLTQEVEDAIKDAIQGSYVDDIPDKLKNLVDLIFETASTSAEVAATIRDHSPVSGAAHGVLGNSQQFTDQLAGRLRPNNSNNGPGTWGGVIGGIGDLDTGPGYDTITAGEIGGYEGPINEDIKVGLALAYIYANVDGTEGLLGDETNVNSLGPAFYARYQPNGLGGLYAQSSVAGAYSFIDQVRVALMTGEQFEADYGGYSISGRAEAGYDASLGQVYLTPYAAGGVNFVALDGYSESGSENGLDVSDFDGVFPMLEGGLRAVFVGEQVEFSALAGYRHEFGDEIIRGSASLDSTSFDTNTTMHSVGSGFISALGVNLRSGDAVFGLSYDGLFGEDRFSHIGSMSISFHM